MANKFSPSSDDFDHAFTAQQQANYTGDNMVNYEQLLMNDHCADYAKLEKSDCENYDVLSKPKIKAYFERENIVPINCKLSVADLQTVENNDYLSVADDGSNGPSTSSSCNNSMSRGPPSSQSSEPYSETPIFNMVDNDNYTIIGHIDVVDDSKHCSGSTFIGEAQNLTSFPNVHDQQQQEHVIRVSDYDNTTQTFDLSDYDNNAGLNVSGVNVSILLVTISSHCFQFNIENKSVVSY
jgi:hypothetical protein